MSVSNPILKRVYSLKGPDDCADLYDDWAKTYDADTTEGMGYVAPKLCAEKLVGRIGADEPVLDAGCGTGLAGVELAARGFKVIDGLDVSAEMLAIAAEKKVYRTLDKADLTKPIALADNSYAAVLCVGTLTHGHVGPDALDELLRVARPGAPVIATIHEGVWEEAGFRTHIEALVARGAARLIEADEAPYHAKEGITCRLCVLEKP